MDRLGADSIAIFWSAPARVYSLDVDYEYRQDSNLLYLTGLDQPDTILVLMPGNRTKREILFVREADARREHWNGHSLTPAEASEQTGIETVLTGNQFEPFVAGILSGQGGSTVSTDEGHAFFEALGQGRARLALLLEPQRNLSDAPGPAREFAARMRDRFFGFDVKDATPVLASLRQIKTPYEQDVLRKSVAISADAHKAGMRAAGPGKWEYEVEAAIEEVYLRNGAMSWGYPSIVGSGPNATILHYQRVEPADAGRRAAARGRGGELSGVDRRHHAHLSGERPLQRRRARHLSDRPGRAGGRHCGGQGRQQGRRHSDGVRRRPPGRAREAGTRHRSRPATSSRSGQPTACRTGSAWTSTTSGRATTPLQPGMAFTIEPGIYIREAALDNLPKTPENQAFIEKVRAAVQKYKDIGVRVEDSFLLTATGVENLSAGVPRTIDAIEQFLKPVSSARR